MAKVIVMIGAFDTKGAEYAFLREQIVARGHRVVAVNVGVLGSTELFPVDVEADEVARAGGKTLEELRRDRDRGVAMQVMYDGAAIIAKRLYDNERLDGVVGMGGSGGTSVITSAMRALPIGVPKVCLTTVIGGDIKRYVGVKDVTLIPSIVDIAGLNRISRLMICRAAGAACGMVEAGVPPQTDERPIITATMFGNTTECVECCSKALTAQGYEVLVFHATGVGGKTMELLVDEGLVTAVLDITTTEWADEVGEGMLSAGPDRLSAPGRQGIPHLIVPGCIDMVNFGGPDTVPGKFRDAGRKFYEWNPAVTLMRTNVEENRRMGAIFAEKANAAKGPVAFLTPLRGVSILDGDGQPFCDREADRAFSEALKAKLRKDIPVVELDCNINDPVFAKRAVEMMLDLIAKGKARGPIG